MKAKNELMTGMNPNPLAPVQSKLTFSFSGKTRNSNENASISPPFFYHFLSLFRAFSRKVAKEVQGPAPELKKTPKWDPKGAQTEPEDHKIEPQGPAK